jgi:L-cysteine:1D-myo-inositol 2-amino-2-deoxy-alpha-D-glucopyranoside ligase
LRIYDTRAGRLVEPDLDEQVRMYVCGITPYDATHLGHASTFLAYDVLVRALIDRGHRVRMVRNVTDVDDPLFAKARELGVHYLDLAAAEERRFDADMLALNAIAPDSAPRASSAISDIRRLIGAVLDAGRAYTSGGAVYFAAAESPSLGSLSGLDREAMLDLAARRGGNIDDPSKRDPLDFVLWQPSAADEPAWDSPWGPGRPGWHVECSALVLRELGETIDIHGGGADLIYPHHECETLQSEAATGVEFARYWMHAALISMNGEKMSKSLGNLVFIDRLRAEWEPVVIRAGITGHHYRTEWEWDDDLMARSAERVARWRQAAGGTLGDCIDAVRDRLADDLDTPGALAAVDEAAVGGQDVTEACALLGLLLD